MVFEWSWLHDSQTGTGSSCDQGATSLCPGIHPVLSRLFVGYKYAWRAEWLTLY